ncbi:hypothetical protein LMG29542_02598 [Paraburkholderia humisilvae]|uniref:Restriction endonuclease domain-containing protein n=1 Tax=Paraburkholderia humisilvae TaxID=627669 RepID=A0A6J5DNG5_9BURK|nr:hypothetical protein LMG29542_02598 [Paraburkholderia humisilvae]
MWASSLRDTEQLALAKGRELYDASEQVRVAPRVSKNGVPHFYEMTSRARSVFSGEDDPTHNNRVKDLHDKLQALDSWALVLTTKDKATGNVDHDEILKFPQYSWGTETHRILDEKAIVRHDIFGQSPDLAMSIRRPWIAIEVVHTHFPEEEAFAAFLDISKRLPLIVLFEHTARRNVFVKIDDKNGLLQISRWTYYIKDGYVWQGHEKTNVSTSARLQIELVGMLKRWDDYGKSKHGSTSAN